MRGTQRAIQDADADLFGTLYPGLRRLAAVVGPIEMDPDDLVQEAVERTLRLGRLCDLPNAEAYLCRAIINLASNQRRHLVRRRRMLTRIGDVAAEQPSYPSDVADLLRLDPQQRAVVFLHYVEGHSYQEIANALEMSVVATRKTASRARRRLRNELADEVTP